MSTVLFDFFGTLVQYSSSRTDQGYGATDRVLREAGCDLAYEVWLRAWEAACEELELEAETSGTEYSMYDAFASFARRIGLGEDASTIATQFVAHYLEEWSRGVQYMTEMPGLLRRLGDAGHQLVLVTNTHDAGMVHRHLGSAGIDTGWTGVITSIEFGLRKPRPEIYEAALALAGTSANEAVFVGDSFGPDYLGPTRQGIDAYLIVEPGVPRPDGLPPTRCLASVTEIEHVLR